MRSCHVCRDDRPDDMLAVASYRFERAGIGMTLRVWYCADREACVLGPLRVAKQWAHGWRPVGERVGA